MLKIVTRSLLIILILLRPFICSLAHSQLDIIYTYILILISVIWLGYNFRTISLTRCGFFVLIFFAAIILSAVLFSFDREKSFLQLYKYLGVVVIFFVFSSLSSSTHHIILPIIIGASFVSLYAILWVFYGADHLLQFLSQYHIRYNFACELVARKRAFVPFVLPSALGGYLIMALPLSIGFLQAKYKNVDIPFFKRPINNSLFLVPVFLISVALIMTKAIGPCLSLILAVLLFFVRQNKKINVRIRILIIFLMITLSGFLFIRSYQTGYWQQPLFSFGQRLVYWQNTWSIIRAHPLVGVGIGNLPFVQSKFSHNTYLQLWAETGLLGLIPFLGIIANMLITCYHRISSDNKVFSGLCIANLAFVFHNFMDFTFFLPEISLFWWIICGLLDSKTHNTINTIK